MILSLVIIKQNIVEILENYEKEKNQDGQRETSDEQEKTETYQEILDINHEKVYEDLHLKYGGGTHRAYIKVQDGCSSSALTASFRSQEEG